MLRPSSAQVDRLMDLLVEAVAHEVMAESSPTPKTTEPPRQAALSISHSASTHHEHSHTSTAPGAT
jgi:hypothetical protein